MSILYQPIEYTASEDTFALLENTSLDCPRENPEGYDPSAKAIKPRRRSRKGEVILPGESYAKFQIKLALIRPARYDIDKAPYIGNSDDIYRLLRSLSSEVVEVFVCVCLNSKHQVIGVYEVARGQSAIVEVLPVEVLRPVLVSGATKFIVAHNHPSGDKVASGADITLTNRLKQAAAILMCQLLDHIIIGGGEHTSLALKGII
jgi:DNA repair protein RadC